MSARCAALLLSLIAAGCATAPAAPPEDVSAALVRSTASLNALAADLANPEAVADPALALADADAALAALLLAGVRAAPAERPALATLAGLVAACRHHVAQPVADGTRTRAARLLAVTCLHPLAAVGFGGPKAPRDPA